jgi:hypothetical protein
MLKKFILLVVFTAVSVISYAQKNIKGKVVDEQNNALTGSTVTLKAGKETKNALVNNAGEFVFENVQEGSFVLKVTSVGFDMYQQSGNLYENLDLYIVM